MKPERRFREREVTPFDLDATLYTFEKSNRGGSERVTTNNPEDDRSIAFVREHLAEEAELFMRGDFSGPGYLYGDDMAGLSVLEKAAAAGGLRVDYGDLPDGAALTLSAGDDTVLAALHAWFGAQVNDHGEHATESNQVGRD